MRVAAVQARPIWLNKTETTQKILNLLAEAATKAVDLVVFPETFLAGYPFWVYRTDGARFDDALQKKAYSQYLDAAVEMNGSELKLITEAARDLRVFVYLGTSERGKVAAKGTVYCTLVAIDPIQGIVSAHRKLMPTWDERLVWGIGDGQGLKVHSVKGVSVGGLNCWENWMPLARYALYSGGEDLHISVWPGAAKVSADIPRLIALEGRVWSVVASGLLSLKDIPADFVFADVLHEQGEEIGFNGGSAIIDPTGHYVLGPLLDEEQLLIADIDLEQVRQERSHLDVTGHYARPDVFDLTVHRRRLSATAFDDPL